MGCDCVKKLLYVLLPLFLIVCVVIVLLGFKVISLPQLDTISKEEEQRFAMSVEDLEDGCFYVWHNEKQSDIKIALRGAVNTNVFKKCPSGLKNWDNNDAGIGHTIWFDTSNDMDIPVLYPGDELLYISNSSVPHEGVEWERFGDYGYTIGVANLSQDQSGHYYIINSDKGYRAYINPNSDAVQLEEFTEVSELFIDKLGSVSVRDGFVSEGGTLFGLSKDTKYLCEWYTGTFYQDYEMTASTHAFCSLEKFTTYDYEFLHSNCISITIPEWLKTGCYYVNGIGFFRYVSANDMYKYNGKPYDANINWNDRIIIYDENHFLLYDPSTGFESDTYKQLKSEKNNKEGNQNLDGSGASDISEDVLYEQYGNDQEKYQENSMENYENESDAGAEMYE